MCWVLCKLGLANKEVKKTDVAYSHRAQGHQASDPWSHSGLISLSLSSHPKANPLGNAV